MTKRQVADLYNRVATDYGQIGPRLFEYSGQRLVQLIGVTTDARVLDTGTGRGASLMPAAELVQPNGLVIGTDIAFQMAHETWNECQRRNLANVWLLQADGDYLALRSSSFNFVLCGFAIFFFPDPDHTLREWYRALIPTGKVGICVVSRGDDRWQWYEQLLIKYQQRHQFPLSPGGSDFREPGAIKELMEIIGLSKVEIIEDSYEFTYTNAEEWWQSKWTHGARFPLEQMSKKVLTQFRTEVFDRLLHAKAENNLNERWQLAYIIGEK
jgi:ubiquinone/menaquinone biosynthesis C-methylase UbiE